MNKIKRIFASLMAAATVGAVSISAFAADTEYYFNFKTYDYGGEDSESAVMKQNQKQYATIKVRGGYVSDTAFAYLSVHANENGNCVSERKKVTITHDDITLDYTTTRGNGSYNFLKASSGYHGIQLSGYWIP